MTVSEVNLDSYRHLPRRRFTNEFKAIELLPIEVSAEVKAPQDRGVRGWS